MTLNLALLREFLQLDVPRAIKKPFGFLEIVDQATRENPISNVYRYFLDEKQSPETSVIMMVSLLELIETRYREKNRELELQFDDFEVKRECWTGKGRIDLVIESEEGKSVIIIEAKIYHYVHNDLEDYWNAFSYQDSKKAGIVLSLHPLKPETIDNSNFINITHSEWFNNVKARGLPHSLEPRTYVYFTDFIKTMDNLKSSNELTPEVQFYFDHFEKVDAAIDARYAAVDYVIAQLRQVCSTFEWTLYGTAEDWKNLWDKKTDSKVYWTVLPLEIIKKRGSIRIILELFDGVKQHEQEIRHLFQENWNKTGFNPIVNNLKFHVHLAEIELRFDPRRMDTLADTMIDWFKNDLEPIRWQIAEYLESKGEGRK